MYQKVVGSIPSQSTYLGCGFDPWARCIQEAVNVSHIDVSLSTPLPISLKSIETSSQVRIKKKKKRPPGGAPYSMPQSLVPPISWFTWPF